MDENDVKRELISMGSMPPVDVAMPRMTAVGASAAPPSHIVVFKHRSRRNAEIIAESTNARDVRAAGDRPGTIRLRTASGTDARVFSRLSVAALDLTPEQHDHLVADTASVLGIVRNERRRLPPFTMDRSPGASRTTRRASFLAQAGGFDDPRAAYLRGMRDALDNALHAFGEAGEAKAPSDRFQLRYAQDSQHSWCLEAIGIRPGYRLTGRGVTVAVLDTGIEYSHPDLAHLNVSSAHARSFVPGQSVIDLNGHGTHCAGVIAGRSTLNTPKYGVAPDVTLLVGKVLSDQGTGYDDGILDGIDWAADSGARVISMSLGSERAVREPFAAAYERVAEALLDDPSGGTLLVCAAGNGSMRPQYVKPIENPAACPSIPAVAAIDRNSRIAYFSCERDPSESYGVDVSAPGVGVLSAYVGGGHEFLSGTSMATPHVAGVAALLLQDRPNCSARDVWKWLCANAQPLGNRDVFGDGLLQVP